MMLPVIAHEVECLAGLQGLVVVAYHAASSINAKVKHKKYNTNFEICTERNKFI